MDADIISNFLPLIIIIGFWIFIMYRMKKNSSNVNRLEQKQEQVVELLGQIRDELKELNNKKS